jgi:Raf kinase inhibitor-like YbhB/YbcL family protein
MFFRRVLLFVIVVAVAFFAVTYFKQLRSMKEQALAQAPSEDAFVLVCRSFGNGNMIPAEYTADGRNVSPALVWANVPEGTQTFALIVEDPDSPIGTFTHWLICEMPRTLRELPEDVPKTDLLSGDVTGVQGNNDFRHLGYGGPNPPPGKEHHYYFHLYALDTTLDMVGSFTKNQLRTAMKGHILGEATLMGRYKHPEAKPEAQAP